jgi:hypothetical protein
MSRKGIIVTFISTAVVIMLVGILSWWMWVNQPTADVATPPVPAEPSNAPSQKPPVPPEPRIMGDVIDDGIVDALDVNGVITQWQQKNSDYNIVNDQNSDDTNVINSLDMIQVFKYWKCYESRSDKSCPYKS